jgi:hypothetical protein
LKVPKREHQPSANDLAIEIQDQHELIDPTNEHPLTPDRAMTPLQIEHIRQSKD